MSLFDQVKDAIAGKIGVSSGDPGAALAQSVTGRDGSSLLSLVQSFEASGMGGVIASWIGTGANQPISGDMLHKVLGSERVQQLASRTGLPVDQVLSQLAARLPSVVDQMTPNGQLPERARSTSNEAGA